MSDKDIIHEAREAFERAQEHESENRKAYVEDMRFARLGEQWPEQIRKQREREGRPVMTINRMPSFIRQVVNDARQNKPSIKIHPVDDTGDVRTAEIISGLIRQIEYASNADIAYDTAIETAVSGGIGYVRVATEYARHDVFDQDIVIKRVADPLTIYGDPSSDAADSSDWNSAFVLEEFDEEEFEARFKGAAKSSFDAVDAGERDSERIVIAEFWTREEVPVKLLRLSNGMALTADEFAKRADVLYAMGVQVVGERDSTAHKVRQHLLSGAEELESNDFPGRYIPIVPVYGEDVVIEGKRHLRSLIHQAKDAQRMFNFWRTSSSELVALAPKAPWIGPRGFAKSDPEKWATANTRSHAYLEYDGSVSPQRVPFTGPDAASLQEAANAQDDMKSILGIYDASLGARSNETSGRAIMARQREGDISTFHFIDNLSRAIRHLGRIVLDLIPHVYSGERMVRVLGEDGRTGQPVRVNAPQQMPDGIVHVFDLTAGKYDLTVQAGPSFTSRREEAAIGMTEFVRSVPQAGPLLGDLIAKAQDWPDADQVAQRMAAMLPPQVQGQNPQMMAAQQQMQQMQQQMTQLAQRLQQAEQDKSIELEKLKVDQYNAETKRLQVAQSQAMSPEQVAAIAAQTVRELLAPNGISTGPAPMPPTEMQGQQPAMPN